MRLEHLNLIVKDIEASVRFYLAVFPTWQARGQGEDEWYGKARRWVHIGDDCQFLTLNDDGEGDNRDLTGHQVGLAHFAFEVDDLALIEKRLQQIGVEVHHYGPNHPYRRNAYFMDPAGYEVEFVQYLSQDPKRRNQYEF